MMAEPPIPMQEPLKIYRHDRKNPREKRQEKTQKRPHVSVRIERFKRQGNRREER
jgi:hypothetical protein